MLAEDEDFDDFDFVRQMQERHKSKFASCECGRKAVLLFKRPKMNNGPDADVYTYHDTPQKTWCEYGGKFAPPERCF